MIEILVLVIIIVLLFFLFSIVVIWKIINKLIKIQEEQDKLNKLFLEELVNFDKRLKKK